jgi:hypothetical protein
MKFLRKAGPLQTVGGGTIWHAVEEGVAVMGGPAVCRDRPGVAWSPYPGHAVTCPRCRDAMSLTNPVAKNKQPNLGPAPNQL